MKIEAKEHILPWRYNSIHAIKTSECNAATFFQFRREVAAIFIRRQRHFDYTRDRRIVVLGSIEHHLLIVEDLDCRAIGVLVDVTRDSDVDFINGQSTLFAPGVNAEGVPFQHILGVFQVSLAQELNLPFKRRIKVHKECDVCDIDGRRRLRRRYFCRWCGRFRR